MATLMAEIGHDGCCSQAGPTGAAALERRIVYNLRSQVNPSEPATYRCCSLIGITRTFNTFRNSYLERDVLAVPW
jgi:hypothetical protein